ncbi:MAG TPA: nuclear transport factor 2 family protein [Bacteroidota bacterium]|nr:nuclear transport factor 2 family protein [Bacteroidota bacterium]
MQTHPPNSDAEQICLVADRWLQAVAAGDKDQLRKLMTEDIVVIHGDGRVASGRERVLADFAIAFETITVRQTLERQELVIAGDWAFDRSTVVTIVSMKAHGEEKEYRSQTITILRKDLPGWRVARSMGIVERGA